METKPHKAARRVKTNEPAVVEIYRDKKKEFRWRAGAPENGKTLSAATEGYKRPEDVIQAMRRTANGLNRFLRQYDKAAEDNQQQAYLEETFR